MKILVTVKQVPDTATQVKIAADGKTIDDDMGAVTAQLAELLGWPCAYWIMEEAIDADGKSVRAARQVEGGLEVFDLPLPAVLAAQKGLNEPRYPTLKGIMGAKKKEIKDVKAADIGWVSEPPQLSVVGLEALPPRPPGRVIQGDVPTAVKELVRALREDAKAIEGRREDSMPNAFRGIVEYDP